MAEVAVFDHLGRVKRAGTTSAAENVPSNVSLIFLLGYSAQGDAPVVSYIYLGMTPQTAEGCFQSNDDRWWGIKPTGDHLDVRWFGAKVDLAVNDTPALVAAIRCAMPAIYSGRELGVRTVFIPAGTIKVTQTIHLRGVTLRGSGTQTTTIALATTNGTCIKMDGGAGLVPPTYATGGGLQSLSIWAHTAVNATAPATGIVGVPVAGGIGVLLEGDATYQPDETVFEDIKITGGGSWQYPIRVNGSSRVLLPDGSGLSGARWIVFRNLFLGNATMRALDVSGVKGMKIDSVGVFGSPPNGTTYKYDVQISGNAGMRSEDVQFHGANIQGTVWVYYTESMTLSGKILEVSFSTGAKGCVFYGTLTTGTAGSGYFGGTGNGNEKYVATL